MMILMGTVRQRIKGLEKEFKAITKRTMLETGAFWHQTILPRHFTWVAHGEYHHKDRMPKWKKDKKEIGKGEGKFLDNVMFGRTRRYTKVGPRYTATSNRCRVIFSVPAYTATPGHDAPEQHPKPAQELIAHTDRDRTVMAKYYDERLDLHAGDALLRAAYYTTQF